MKFRTDFKYADILSILEKNPNTTINFRYFSKRTEECLLNHKYHFILYDTYPVGYGHLDYDSEKTWLGMCVFDDYVGKGYGKVILDNLIENRRGEELFLSVDKENYRAINLYLNRGFKIYSQLDTLYFCRFNKGV
jgi:GNAT superfamily N-acetyltransferase